MVTPLQILSCAFCLYWIGYPHLCLGYILGHQSALYHFSGDTYSGVEYASAVQTIY